jgi:hypothetical protein
MPDCESHFTVAHDRESRAGSPERAPAEYECRRQARGPLKVVVRVTHPVQGAVVRLKADEFIAIARNYDAGSEDEHAR